jgi:hypothetical protein
MINLSSPSNLGSLGSTQMTVNGRCSPPYEVGNWGLGWSVLGALEENVSGVWQPRDSRLLVIGQWPRVNGFIGPGGGVITISPTFGSSAQPVLLDVYLGPLSGIRAGGAWRISPTDNGGISSYYSSQWFTSAYRQIPVNGLPFTIQTTSVAGFTSPASQIINITQSGARLDLAYFVNPPQLTVSKINGIGISGTTGTVYSIDYTPRVPTNNWSSLLNVSLLKNGVNSATNPITTNGNLFFRARWLPDQ